MNTRRQPLGTMFWFEFLAGFQFFLCVFFAILKTDPTKFICSIACERRRISDCCFSLPEILLHWQAIYNSE